MDLDRVRELMALLQESDLTELEVQDGDSRIRLVRPAPETAAPIPGAESGPARGAPAGSPAALSSAAGTPLSAPMAGTFYAAPEPGAEPFLTAGGRVQAGQVVCIIESMKMMNEIRAERSGVCQTIVAHNGEPVRAGDTLFVIG